jgi:uncharacterized protein (DUF1330 family)
MEARTIIILALLSAALGAGAFQSLHALTMPPAYVVTEVDIADAEAFREYAPQVQPSFAPYGGRYLVRGGASRSLVGEAPKRIVVLAFDSMERARAWYESPAYDALKPLRDKAGRARIFAVEGLSP